MSGIGIITNPHSKLNKRNPNRPHLLGYILGTQGQLEITNTLEELDDVAQKFCEQGIEILAINGGDGTVARTITAFIKAYGDQPLPKIALLRGGTMNVLATNLKILGRPEKLLYRLVEAYGSNKSFKTELVTTLDVDGQFGFLFADGIACNVLKKFYENKTGPLGALWLVFRIIFSAIIRGQLAKQLIRSHLLRIQPSEGQEFSASTCTLMAATIEKMPMGPRLFPKARERADHMQYFYTLTTPEQLPWKLPWLLTPPKVGQSSVRVSNCTPSLEIASERGYTYSLDGELFHSDSGKITVKTGPKLEFLTYRLAI